MRPRDNILVGAVITAAFVVLVVGTLWLVRGGLQGGYPMYVRLPWGSGIKQGQTVFLTGVDVGFVSAVDLRTDGTLVVEMRIRKQFRIPEGTTASIEPNGFFGDVDVALRPSRPTTSYIPPRDTVPAGKPAPTMAQLLARADSASTRLGDVARVVQVEMVQGGGIADLRKTLESANALVVQLSGIAAAQSRYLDRTMRSLSRTVSAIDSATVDSAVKNLKTTTANMSDLTNNLERATSQLDAVLVKVDSGGGTVGKFVNDPAVYNNLQAVLARLDSLTADLRRNPKRYINVHIF